MGEELRRQEIDFIQLPLLFVGNLSLRKQFTDDAPYASFPVLRIDEYKFDAEFLSLHPEARPIRFTASAVGTKGSDAKVLLSPGQSVLARDDAGQETLRIASEFLARPGIMAEPGGAFSYFVFHLGQAALVKAEGMWVSLGE